MIDRRAFIVGAVASLAWPVTARAEPAPGMHRIGYLTPFSLTGSVMDAFRAGLLDHGYVEGKNIRIEARSSDQDASRLAALAADLVSAKVDLIVAQTGQAALAAKHATSRIPIVMASSADAVAQGIIVSLAHPGSNVTGFTLISPDYVPKRIELLRETLPKATRVAVLVCSDSLTKRDELASAEASARRFGLRVQAVEYQTPASWDAIALSMERSRPDAMFMRRTFRCPLVALHLAGIGQVIDGMHGQGYDRQLTQYDERGWRAAFYVTGMEHSATSATASAWKPTPWRAVERAAFDALRAAS